MLFFFWQNFCCSSLNRKHFCVIRRRASWLRRGHTISATHVRTYVCHTETQFLCHAETHFLWGFSQMDSSRISAKTGYAGAAKGQGPVRRRDVQVRHGPGLLPFTQLRQVMPGRVGLTVRRTRTYVRTHVRRVWGDRPVRPDGVLTNSLNRLPASRDEVAVWRCVHDKIDDRGSMIVAGGVTRVTRDPVTA